MNQFAIEKILCQKCGLFRFKIIFFILGASNWAKMSRRQKKHELLHYVDTIVIFYELVNQRVKSPITRKIIITHEFRFGLA